MRLTFSAAVLPLLLLPAALLAGCNNTCQQLCVEMRDFALDECGYEFSEAEVDTCISEHAGSMLDKGEAGVCRDGRGKIAEEWDCEEVAAYFDDGQGGDTGADDSGG